MLSDFNAYLHWLDIPPSEQPPNHYRLLSLRKFESDRAVIEQAAEAALTHLLQFAGGEHGQAWQQIIVELETARETLTDPNAKAEYDAGLQRQAHPETAVKPPPPAPGTSSPQPRPPETQIKGTPPVPGTEIKTPTDTTTAQANPASSTNSDSSTAPPSDAQPAAPISSPAPQAVPVSAPRPQPSTPTVPSPAYSQTSWPSSPAPQHGANVPLASSPASPSPASSAPDVSPPTVPPPVSPPAASPTSGRGAAKSDWIPKARTGSIGKAVSSSVDGGPRTESKTSTSKQLRRQLRRNSLMRTAGFVIFAMVFFFLSFLALIIGLAS